MVSTKTFEGLIDTIAECRKFVEIMDGFVNPETITVTDVEGRSKSPTPSPTKVNLNRHRRLSSTRSDLIPFEIECLKFILKETVSKLIIANGGEKPMYVHPSETKQPIKVRFRDSVREKLFHEETLEPINEAMERMIFVKLGNDV